MLDGEILIEAGAERQVAAAGYGIDITGPGLTLDDYAQTPPAVG